MLINYLHPHKIAINEMATLNIGGYASPIIINALPEPSVNKLKHGNRIKVMRGPNYTHGSVPVDLSNQDYEGKLDARTLQTVTTFIQEYRELIDALEKGQINNKQFRAIYKETKKQGLKALPHLIHDVVRLPQTLKKIGERPPVDPDAPYRHQMPTTEGWLFIRGARIIQAISIFEASNYNDLEQNIIRGFPQTRKRQYATQPVQIVQMNLFPAVPSKSLHVKTLARSAGRKYDPEILFSDVVYEDEDTPTNITFKANDGEDYHIIPIRLNENNCKVRCTCLDFYFRFSYWNHSDDSLQGPLPPPYTRRTTTRPPVNPDRVPGICKHIIKSVMALSEAGLVET